MRNRQKTALGYSLSCSATVRFSPWLSETERSLSSLTSTEASSHGTDLTANQTTRDPTKRLHSQTSKQPPNHWRCSHLATQPATKTPNKAVKATSKAAKQATSRPAYQADSQGVNRWIRQSAHLPPNDKKDSYPTSQPCRTTSNEPTNSRL